MTVLFAFRRAAQLGALLSVLWCMQAHAQELPAELNQLVAFIEKPENYPETYNGTHYRVRVEGFALGDAAEDGSRLAFLLIDPHYHQTAPIQIYRFDAHGEIRRVVEALAPGPLIARDGRRLDAHTLGLGVDMSGAKAANGEDRSAAFARKGAAKSHMVLYKHFIHMDLPADAAGFIDVSDRDEFADENTCEKFQFSQPSSIAVGAAVAGENGVQLAAVVGSEIYVYRIARLTTDGLLDKTLTRLAMPAGVQQLQRMPDGHLGLTFADGHSEALVR